MTAGKLSHRIQAREKYYEAKMLVTIAIRKPWIFHKKNSLCAPFLKRVYNLVSKIVGPPV